MKILENILTDKLNRKQLIAQFQKMAWEDEKAPEILSNLAYDLDFYEQDESIREQEPSYFGDEMLEIEITSVLKKLTSDDGR